MRTRSIVLIAALLGGGIAITTHTTKLGLRYAIDASPEPVTNGVANITELGLVAAVAIAIWHHPIITLGDRAASCSSCLMVMVRLIWRALRQVFSGRWMPAPGLDAGTARDGAPRRPHDDEHEI